eukprot:TRINITY_DN15737_c0_g1_i1.p1 TRINITY_DN15737_c0_g1~~TRINITY_DN15737_c0_g1_i1.p1  ORF type:complete len:377 (+),score=79.01 TRINITY_DN15737_c0_g1_i1:146-1132(+)
MGKPCRICDRPFDAFRWKPAIKKTAAGLAGGFKATTICKVCARLRNVCQSCLLDVHLSLPSHVRDSVLDEQDRVAALPSSEVGRNFQQDLHERKVDLGIESSAATPRNYQPATLLDKLDQRGGSTSATSLGDVLAQLCPFHLKGKCDRGSNCALKHEKPESLEINADLYPPPPADKNFKTLFLGNIDTDFTETDIILVFETYGPLAMIRLIPQKMIGFVEMANRIDAEAAVRELWGVLTIKNVQVRVDWAKSATPTDRTTKRKREDNTAGGPSKGRDTAEKSPKMQAVRSTSPDSVPVSRIPLPPGVKLDSIKPVGEKPKLIRSKYIN